MQSEHFEATESCDDSCNFTASTSETPTTTGLHVTSKSKSIDIGSHETAQL